MHPDILVTGSGGLLGYAVRQICPDAVFIRRSDCDLRDIQQVQKMFDTIKPKRVIHLAAVVGGVKMNLARNADLFEENILINTNVLKTACRTNVLRLISVLSNCSFSFYPDRVSSEEDLHSGLPFKGNAGYAYAKRMLDVETRLVWEQYGAKFSTLAPVNIYGPNDNWDLENGHVVASLIHKCFVAKQLDQPLAVWGSGNAIRQFVFSLDVARILVQALDSFSGPDTVIVAPDSGVTIGELARLIAHVMDFKGTILFDSKQPEGQFSKILKSKRFSDLFGTFNFTRLEDGLKKTVDWFYQHGSVPILNKA